MTLHETHISVPRSKVLLQHSCHELEHSCLWINPLGLLLRYSDRAECLGHRLFVQSDGNNHFLVFDRKVQDIGHELGKINQSTNDQIWNTLSEDKPQSGKACFSETPEQSISVLSISYWTQSNWFQLSAWQTEPSVIDFSSQHGKLNPWGIISWQFSEAVFTVLSYPFIPNLMKSDHFMNDSHIIFIVSWMAQESGGKSRYMNNC